MEKTFNELKLKPSLISALEKEKITVPTDIQQKTIPELLKNRDVIAQSETGTGKTLAYLLPLFEKIDPTRPEMQAMILVPTHELAIQIQRQIERLSENSDLIISSIPIIGNVNIARQIEKLKEKPHIIVGSAGRILELIKKKKITAHTIKTIILDEADRLMDKNNLESVRAVVKSTLKERQVMLFSATISQDTLQKAKEIMKEPEIIRAEAQASVPAAIEHVYFMAEQREKVDVLRKLTRIMNPEKAIAFVNKSEEIEVLTSKLKHHGLNAEAIHGANFKLERKKILDDFRAGKIQLLVASDIAARGLDIEGVTHIINVSMPEDPKDYLHRVGRTGRKGLAGTAVSIVTDRELSLLELYEKSFKITILPKDMYQGRIINPLERKTLKKSLPVQGEAKTEKVLKPGKKY